MSSSIFSIASVIGEHSAVLKAFRKTLDLRAHLQVPSGRGGSLCLAGLLVLWG